VRINEKGTTLALIVEEPETKSRRRSTGRGKMTDSCALRIIFGGKFPSGQEPGRRSNGSGEIGRSGPAPEEKGGLMTKSFLAGPKDVKHEKPVKEVETG